MQVSFTFDDVSEIPAELLELLGTAPAPAAKPAAAKAAAKPATAKAKAAPVEEPDTDPADDDDPLSPAVKLATAMVSAGEAAKVKAALGKQGVKRVSELTVKQVAPFMADLEATDDEPADYDLV